MNIFLKGESNKSSILWCMIAHADEYAANDNVVLQ